MKRRVQLVISLFFGLAFIVCIFPFAFVEAAEFQSEVTINAKNLPPLDVFCVDNNGDGVDDNTGAACGSKAGTAGTCGLEIISGVPINYGQINLGQLSNEQKVTYKNEGTANAQIMVKASHWITGNDTNPIRVGLAENTRVATTPGMEFANKLPLGTSETTLDQLGPGQTGESYWSMYATTGMSGSPHQKVWIELNC